MYELKIGRRVVERLPKIQKPHKPRAAKREVAVDVADNKRRLIAAQNVRKLGLSRDTELEIVLRSVILAYEKTLQVLQPSAVASALVSGTMQHYITLAKPY